MKSVNGDWRDSWSPKAISFHEWRWYFNFERRNEGYRFTLSDPRHTLEYIPQFYVKTKRLIFAVQLQIFSAWREACVELIDRAIKDGCNMETLISHYSFCMGEKQVREYFKMRRDLEFTKIVFVG